MSVTNAARGLVKISLGGEVFTARLTFGALREAAEELGYEDGDALMAAFSEKAGNTRMVMTLLVHALRRGSKPDASIAWLEEQIAVGDTKTEMLAGLQRVMGAANVGDPTPAPFGGPASRAEPAGDATPS